MKIFQNKTFLIWGLAVPAYAVWQIWTSGAPDIAGLLF